jgi:sulfur carrier protein
MTPTPLAVVVTSYLINGASMEITVNGNSSTIDKMSVIAYLRTLDIDPKRVAVELNLEILPKADYETTVLNDGDRIEIVQFVGGG